MPLGGVAAGPGAYSRLLVLIALASVFATGCDATRSKSPGEGLLTRSLEGNGVEMTAIVGGTLELDPDRGCVLLSGKPVVWPAATTLKGDPLELHLPGGDIARSGDTITGGGGEIPAARIRETSIRIEGDLTKALACAPADSEVLVLWARGGQISVLGADRTVLSSTAQIARQPRPLSPSPTRVLVSCERSRLLRPACPRRLPAAYRYTNSLCPAGKRGCLFPERIDMFNIESLRSPNRIRRRPSFVHLVVYAGDLGGPKGFQSHAHSAFPFDWPHVSSAQALMDGISRHRRAEAVALGRRRFGAVRGELVLAPATQAMDGGHLIFRWHSGQREYAVSLHAWEPLTEAAATLRTVVATVPAARR